MTTNLVIQEDGTMLLNGDTYDSASFAIQGNLLEFYGYKPVSFRAETTITTRERLDIIEPASIQHSRDGNNTPYIPMGQWYTLKEKQYEFICTSNFTITDRRKPAEL